MSAVVKIDFRVGGTDAVLRAFKTITQATEASARQEVKVAQTAVDKVAKVRKDGAARAAEATAAAEKRAAARSESNTATASRRRQMALGASMSADIKATEAAAKRKETAEASSARRREATEVAVIKRKQMALGSSVASDIRETERAARRKEAIEATSTRRKEVADTASARRRDVAHASRLNAGFREEERATKRTVTLAARQEARAAKQSTAATRGFFTDTGQGAGRGFRSGMGVVNAGAGLVAGAIGTSGIVAAVQSSMALESGAAQLAADVRTGDGKFIDQKSLISDSQRVARSTGIKSEDVMEAMTVASSQGGGLAGLQAFRGALDDMGTIALASGTKIEDLASISATMTNNMVTDSAKQKRLMLGINAAAKEGNVNFREMAANVMEVAGQHQALGFAGTSERRIELASGMIQMAKQGGAGSAAEAATGARSFMADLAGPKAVKYLKSKGIQTYKTDKTTGKKTARDVEDLVVDLFKASKNDPEILATLFDQRSKMTQSSISKAFGNNGEKGIRDLFKQFTGANQTDAQITQEAGLQKSTTANQVSRAMEDFKAKVGNELLPVLAGAIPQFAKLAEVVAMLVKEFAESPKTMVAKFVALSTMLGAAQAAIGNVIGRAASSLLERFLGTSVGQMNVTAGSVNMASAGGVPGGAAGLNAASAAHVLAAGAIGYGVGTTVASATDKDLKKSDTFGAAMEAQSIMGAMRAGKGTPADRKRLVELQASIRGEQEKGVGQRLLEGTTAGARGLLSGDISMGNVASLLPPVAAARGITSAVLGDQQASGDTTSQGTLKEIASLLAKPQPQDDVVNAINNLGTTIAAANLQGPKVPTP